MAYIYFNNNPLGKSTGDCVIRAISIALNQSWDETYWDLCECGFTVLIEGTVMVILAVTTRK